MSRARLHGDGAITVETSAYRLRVPAAGTLADLDGPDGEPWARLRLLSAFDRVDAHDETVAVEPPRLEGDDILVARRSTAWDEATLTIACGEDALEVRAAVRGRGALDAVHLLGGRSLVAGGPTGWFASGSGFRTLFSPNPGDPSRLVRSAAEAAAIGVVGDSAPGRGHWFFTPAPLLLAAATERGNGWLSFAVTAPVEELTFTQLAWEPADLAFSLRLDYEGHTFVDGAFAAPALLLTPGHADPPAALRRYRADLAARGHAPAPGPRDEPAWWREPLFCGWGAQCHLARRDGVPAPALATQASYDAFLAALEKRGIVPPTIVIDDKWQDAYGTNGPDRAKWPDLRGWIAARHERGQRVLLWWKAWDPEGLPPELCVRNPDGAAVAVDPTNPAAREAVRASVTNMLAPDGLGADGLKIDFTAQGPSGRGLRAHGPAWGIALLYELLKVVYGAAKAANPEALVITHTPHPAFVAVTDMLRLNDMLRLDDRGPRPDVVAQMRQRADVVAAACPELPIDTDDWCVPDLESWRAYLDVKGRLGVPALYYVDHVDLTGEALEDRDYARIREVWEERAWTA